MYHQVDLTALVLNIIGVWTLTCMSVFFVLNTTGAKMFEWPGPAQTRMVVIYCGLDVIFNAAMMFGIVISLVHHDGRAGVGPRGLGPTRVRDELAGYVCFQLKEKTLRSVLQRPDVTTTVEKR